MGGHFHLRRATVGRLAMGGSDFAAVHHLAADPRQWRADAGGQCRQAMGRGCRLPGVQARHARSVDNLNVHTVTITFFTLEFDGVAMQNVVLSEELQK